MVIKSHTILLNLAGEFVAELEAGTSWIGLLNDMVLELRYIFCSISGNSVLAKLQSLFWKWNA